VSAPAVLDDVVQCLLRDAIQTQCRVLRNHAWLWIVCELYIQPMTVAQLFAQAADSDYEPQLLQFRGMKLVGQIMDGRR
jgi:hypothetical protein